MKRYLNIIWILAILGFVAVWQSNPPIRGRTLQPEEMRIQGIALQTTHDVIARRWEELGERNGLYVFGDTSTDAEGRDWDLLAATFDKYDRACLLKGTDFGCTRAPSASWNDLKKLGLSPEPETRPIRGWPGAEVTYYKDLGFFVLDLDGVAREFFLMTPEFAEVTWEGVVEDSE